MEEKEIGVITHFFDKIRVAVIELKDELQVGDKIHVNGKNSDFEQTVDSMQVDHAPVQNAKSGDAVGMHVAEPVHEKDVVSKITAA